MVATYYGPGNTGLVAWVAYTLVNGNWQPVVKGRGAVKLSVVGADFKTTEPIFRPGDPRCCPTGGTRSQTWHWNGSTFVPSAWNYSKTVVRFYTPSLNIRCEMSDNGSSQSSVFCDMEKPPAIVGVLANGHVSIHRGGTGNFGEGPPSRLLPYGSSATVGRFRCKSAYAGVTCVVTATGKGFFVSKRSIRAVG